MTKTNSKGLGDTIEKITTATGIKKVVELFTPDGDDCGCEKRKQQLNAIFPRRHANCMDAKQFKKFAGMQIPIRAGIKRGVMSNDHRKIVAHLHAEVFNHRLIMPSPSCSSCGKKYKRMFDDLSKVYQLYINEIKATKNGKKK